jgi:hypothetical protein
MSRDFEDRIDKTKEKEVYIAFELYRIIKDAISQRLVYDKSGCEFREVIPEFPVGERRADLTVFATKYGGRIEPFLVIEVKRRAYDRPGPSMARAVRRASSYAEGLGATITPFFAVYDGWELMVFRHIDPYLVGAYGAIKDAYKAGEFLKGLEEFSYTGKKDLLSALPKHPDPDFLLKRITPSVIKEFTKDSREAETLLTRWKGML